MPKYKRVEPNVGFWKKGDDFNGCLEQAGGDVAKACLLYSEFCRENADLLRRLSEELKNMEDVTAYGNTHMIQITLKEEDAVKLIEQSLASLDPFEDEEDEDDEEENS